MSFQTYIKNELIPAQMFEVLAKNNDGIGNNPKSQIVFELTKKLHNVSAGQ